MSEEFKLFVGGLHPDTSNTSMLDYFKPYGEIADCVVMKDSGRPRGFGFVTFADKSSYDEVLEKKEHNIDGRLVEVKRAVPRNEMKPSSSQVSHRVKRLFLGGMSKSIRENEILEAIEKHCGEGTVERVEVITDKDTNEPRGFGFVTFKGESEAYGIVDRLLGNARAKYITIGEREVEVKPAVSKEEMRRHDGGRGSRSYSGGSGGSYGYSSSRDMPPSRGPSMYDGMSSGGYYGGGGGYDYMQQRPTRTSDYSMSGGYGSMYDRGVGGSYGYDSSAASSYPYKYSGSGMVTGYPQTASSYGPTRGYEYKERDTRGPYHPYARR